MEKINLRTLDNLFQNNLIIALDWIDLSFMNKKFG